MFLLRRFCFFFPHVKFSDEEFSHSFVLLLLFRFSPFLTNFCSSIALQVVQTSVSPLLKFLFYLNFILSFKFLPLG